MSCKMHLNSTPNMYLKARSGPKRWPRSDHVGPKRVTRQPVEPQWRPHDKTNNDDMKLENALLKQYIDDTNQTK